MENLTCISCPNGCNLTAEKVQEKWIIKGNSCPKGIEFAINEMTCPKRSICSTVRTTFKKVPRLPVRTNGEIPLGDIFKVMNEINSVNLKQKVHCGDVVIKNVCSTGIDIIATSDLSDD